MSNTYTKQSQEVSRKSFREECKNDTQLKVMRGIRGVLVVVTLVAFWAIWPLMFSQYKEYWPVIFIPILLLVIVESIIASRTEHIKRTYLGL